MSPVDYTGPVFSGVGNNGEFNCGESPIFSSPTASDDCSTATIGFADSVTGNNCAGDIITRIWTATDACGNTSTAKSDDVAG